MRKIVLYSEDLKGENGVIMKRSKALLLGWLSLVLISTSFVSILKTLGVDANIRYIIICISSVIIGIVTFVYLNKDEE